MSEKKMMSRNVVVALGIICIVLIAGLSGVIAYYTRAINDEKSQYDSYVTSHSRTNAEYDSYVASHNHNDSDYNALVTENSSLQAQVKNLQSPEVLKINLQGDDNYLPSQISFLHIHGYLFNAGTLTASGIKLYVVLYSLENTPVEAYVDIGSLEGRTWTSVDANVTYNATGFLITGWTATPQWTATP